MSEQRDAAAIKRLLDAYALGLRRYLEAERALADASGPVPAELVFAHHLALEDFQTIRNILHASLRKSEALRTVEDWHP